MDAKNFISKVETQTDNPALGNLVKEAEYSDYADHGEILCPHTATGVRTLEGLRQEGAAGAWAVVATAHAAKFDTIVEPLIGRGIAVPEALAGLLARPATAEPLAATYAALRGYLLGN